MRILQLYREKAAAVARGHVRAAVALELARGGDLAAAGRAAHRAADAQAARSMERLALAAPDCAPGCSSCCHVHVEATSVEVAAVVAHLLETRTPAELRELAERAARAAELTAEARWQARLPCSLLARDGTCSVHDVRPLRCRALHSYSVGACRAAFEGSTNEAPPRSLALERVVDAAEEGLDEALRDAGMSVDAVTLEGALAVALAARAPRPGS